MQAGIVASDPEGVSIWPLSHRPWDATASPCHRIVASIRSVPDLRTLLPEAQGMLNAVTVMASPSDEY